MYKILDLRGIEIRGSTSSHWSNYYKYGIPIKRELLPLMSAQKKTTLEEWG